MLDGVTTPGTHALRTATPSSTCREFEELRFCTKSLYGATFPSCKSIAGEVSPQTHDNPKLWMDAILLLGMHHVLFVFSALFQASPRKNVFRYEFRFVMFSHWSDAEHWKLHIKAVLWICHFMGTAFQFFWHKATSTFAPGHALAVSPGSRVPHLLVEKPQWPPRWTWTWRRFILSFCKQNGLIWICTCHHLPVFIFLFLITLVSSRIA